MTGYVVKQTGIVTEKKELLGIMVGSGIYR
jgi:hypothetical protein